MSDGIGPMTYVRWQSQDICLGRHGNRRVARSWLRGAPVAAALVRRAAWAAKWTAPTVVEVVGCGGVW